MIPQRLLNCKVFKTLFFRWKYVFPQQNPIFTVSGFSTDRPRILKQTGSFQLWFYLSVYDLLVDTKYRWLKHFNVFTKYYAF